MKNVQLKDKETKENIYPVNNLDSTVVDGSETKTWRDVIKNSSGGGGTDYSDYFETWTSADGCHSINFKNSSIIFGGNSTIYPSGSISINHTVRLNSDAKLWTESSIIYKTKSTKLNADLATTLEDLEKRIKVLENS